MKIGVIVRDKLIALLETKELDFIHRAILLNEALDEPLFSEKEIISFFGESLCC